MANSFAARKPFHSYSPVSPGTGNRPDQFLRTGAKPAGLPPDISVYIGIDQVFAGNLVPFQAGPEFRPVPGTHQRQRRQIASRAWFRSHPSKRIGAIPGAIFVNDRTVKAIAQLDRLGLLPAFHSDGVLHHGELPPGALI